MIDVVKALADRAWSSFRSGKGPGARLLRGLAHASVLTAMGLPLAFATQVTLARVLGADDYGVYAFVLSILNIAAIYVTLGLDNVSLREVSAFVAREDWPGIRAFARHAYRTTFLVCFALAPIAILVAIFWPGLDRQTAWALATLPILLPVTATMVVQTCMLQSTGDVLWAQLPAGVIRPILLILALLVAVSLAHHKLPPAEVLLLSAGAGGICLFISDYFLRRRSHFAHARQVGPSEKQEWLRLGRSLLGVSTFQMAASQQLGIFMIGLLKAPREAGIYSAANQVSLPVSIGVGAVLFVAAPMLAQYHAANRREDLQRTLHLSVLAAAGLTVPALILFALLGRWALGLYGPEFRSGYPILLVLSLSHVIVSLGGGVGGYLLSVSGNEKANLRITAISAIVNFLLVLALVGRFGMLGVAIAFTSAMLLRMMLIARFISKTMGLSLIPSTLPRWPSRTTAAP